MNMGRYGSSAARLLIHVPPIPKANNTSGPTQHSDAPIAAAAAAMMVPLLLLFVLEEFTSDISFLQLS